MDVADALPDHPEARYWRRILNEIQVALHQCPVNVRRRQLGKQEINSVWFWGGGFIPDAAPHDLIDTVYSTHSVTRGLAIINDCSMRTGDEAMASDFRRDGRSILVDWSPSSGDPAEELNLIEDLVSRLLKRVHQGHGTLSVFDGSGDGADLRPERQPALLEAKVAAVPGGWPRLPGHDPTASNPGPARPALNERARRRPSSGIAPRYWRRAESPALKSCPWT